MRLKAAGIALLVAFGAWLFLEYADPLPFVEVPPEAIGAAHPSVIGPPGSEADLGPENRPPVRVTPPSRAVRTTLRVSGCNESTPPSGGGLSREAEVVQAELWDRTIALLRSGEASTDLRVGLQAVFGELRGVDAGIDRLAGASDRNRDEFDHATAAAFVIAMRHLGAGRLGEAERLEQRLDELDPHSPLGPMARAVRARYQRNVGLEREALNETLSRDGELHGVALTLAIREMHRGRAADALEALEIYMRDAPTNDDWALETRPRLERRAALEATMLEVERDGVTLLRAADIDEVAALRVHGTVLAALDDAAHLLGGTRRPRLLVFLYGSLADFRAATCGPGWSGARYDGTLRVPGSLVGGDRERITLRHEALHAQLAHMAPRAPLWLHEGVAQLFQGELPSDLERTMRLMHRERTYVPFPSLEGSFMVIDDSDSARFAYHQSYAMVAAAIDREPNALPQAVRFLREGGQTPELLGAMSDPPLDGDALLAWIGRRLPTR